MQIKLEMDTMTIVSRIRNFAKAISSKDNNYSADMNPDWISMQHDIAVAKNVIDLGCGVTPHPQANVGVDYFLEPEQRLGGTGKIINVKEMSREGFEFHNLRVDLPLPFQNDEFDFAYSSHVFEHVEDPICACMEIQRIAKAGCILTPAPFAEYAFGRPYHRWIVTKRSNRLIFLEKRPEDDRPFGDHPVFITGKLKPSPQSNPFDEVLNDGDWHKKTIRPKKLQNKLREMWYTHQSTIETVFNFKGAFKVTVVRASGEVDNV